MQVQRLLSCLSRVCVNCGLDVAFPVNRPGTNFLLATIANQEVILRAGYRTRWSDQWGRGGEQFIRDGDLLGPRQFKAVTGTSHPSACRRVMTGPDSVPFARCRCPLNAPCSRWLMLNKTSAIACAKVRSGPIYGYSQLARIVFFKFMAADFE